MLIGNVNLIRFDDFFLKKIIHFPFFPLKIHRNQRKTLVLFLKILVLPCTPKNNDNQYTKRCVFVMGMALGYRLLAQMRFRGPKGPKTGENGLFLHILVICKVVSYCTPKKGEKMNLRMCIDDRNRASRPY